MAAPKTWTLEQLLERGRAAAVEVAPLLEKLKPILAGIHPGVQGAALMELTGIWLAGNPPEMRSLLLQMHYDGVRAMAEHVAPQLWGSEGEAKH